MWVVQFHTNIMSDSGKEFFSTGLILIGTIKVSNSNSVYPCQDVVRIILKKGMYRVLSSMLLE